MTWYEARLKPAADPQALYQALREWPVRSHHFWDEPWWPGAYVVRVNVRRDRGLVDLLESRSDVDHVVPWDVTPDAEFYGETWPHVRDLFETASMLADVDDATATRLLHCFLNARGMSERDEAKWALRFAWGRLTIKLRWKLYLRRRWEASQP